MNLNQQFSDVQALNTELAKGGGRLYVFEDPACDHRITVLAGTNRASYTLARGVAGSPSTAARYIANNMATLRAVAAKWGVCLTAAEQEAARDKRDEARFAAAYARQAALRAAT